VRTAASIGRREFSVCILTFGEYAYSNVGRAEQTGKNDSKIKAFGTVPVFPQAKFLSAHCFGSRFPALRFSPPRAGDSSNALMLRDSMRHHRPKFPGLRRFQPGVRP
jgi:hypothetical protein